MENKNITSRFLCVFSSVLKKWRSIVLIVCLSGILFDMIQSLNYYPLYSAKAICAIVDNDDKGLAVENASKANTSIQYLLNSQYMKDMVNKSLKQDSFNGEILTNLTSDTNFTTIEVRASSQKDSYFELVSLIDEYNKASKRSSFGYKLTIVEDISFTNYPINSNSHVYNYKTGFTFSLILCLGIISLYYYLKDNVKTESDINDKIDVRLFAKIPREIKKYQKFRLFNHKKTAILVSHFKTGFSYVEAMNKLASKVEEEYKKHNYKTFLVTSSLENEGKSSVAVNLAISLAKNKHKVLIIDADLRKPALHKIFECKVENSLVDILKYQKKIKDCIVSLEKEHIDVIFSKIEEQSQDILSQYDFKILLRTLKRDYDYIIIDSAPSRYIADTSIIASSCDATFVVVKQNEATCKVVNDTIYHLNNASTNIIGCIYNGSVYNPFKGQAMYGYRYGYYRYHRERRS